MIRIVVVLLYLLSYSLPYGCTEISNICVEGPSEKSINGKKVFRDCWKYETQYECFGETYKDYCVAIAKTKGCEQVESHCSKQRDDKCIEFKHTYVCGDLLSQHTQGAILLDTEHTIVEDELDNKACLGNEINPNCVESESICVEGAEERTMNGTKIYKDCWKYERKYTCFTESKESSCAQYDKKCTLDSTKCFSRDKNGNCTHLEKHYTCTRLNGHMPVTLDCRTAKVCIGGDCTTSSYEGNKNIGNAISALSILSGLKKELTPEDCAKGPEHCKVLKGEHNKCSVATTGMRNCCKDSGWGIDVKLTQCSPESKMLATQKSTGLCHLVGSYCSKKLDLGLTNICLEKTQSYCCFNSKISRIIHEQGRHQLGKNWGSAAKPNCAPLTITELQQLDFSGIDLSELYSDIISQTNTAAYTSMVSKAQTNIDQKIVDKLLERERLSHDSKSQNTEYKDEIARRVNEYYNQ